MPLTRICVWEPKIGYRRVTKDEASNMYPYDGVSASSGIFVCELCAQTVCFTALGKQSRHFRHDSAAQKKDCEERQSQKYGCWRASSKNSHTLPIRIRLNGSSFSFQLGFFAPAKEKCSKIKITCCNLEYSFERIENKGITYLDIGNMPYPEYSLSYEQPSTNLSLYWPEATPGINPEGSFFEVSSGKMLPAGAEAATGKEYYLLCKQSYLCHPQEIAVQKLCESCESGSRWFLYRISINSFSKEAARFFLKRSIFLTESPAKFYPIWPACIRDTYFIYHNAFSLYFYMPGKDSKLNAFPAPRLQPQCTELKNSRLYKVQTFSKEQLLALGLSGALGFSYLLKAPLNKESPLPAVELTDNRGNILTEANYAKLPELRLLYVLSKFDGKALIYKNQKLRLIYKLTAGQQLEIDALTFGTEIQIFQGCDRVRSIRFIKEIVPYDSEAADLDLLKKLQACRSGFIEVPHSLGALAGKLASSPHTRQWLRAALRQGKIPRAAYRLLLNHVGKITGGKKNGI